MKPEIASNSENIAIRAEADIMDSFDEELEMELDDDRLAALLGDAARHPESAETSTGASALRSYSGFKENL